MPEEKTNSSVRVDPDHLRSAIDQFEYAALQVSQIVTRVRDQGRLDKPWTQDEISVSMANHYNDQVFLGEYSTFGALVRYESELRKAIDTLRLTLSSYERTDAEAAASLTLP